MKKILHAAALAALAMIATAAPAATKTITFNGLNVFGGPTPLNNATLTVQIESTTNALGRNFITGISGDVDGDVITGLLALEGPATCPCFPEGFAALGGALSISNTLYFGTNPFSPGQFLDHGGLGFRSAGTYYNLYGIGDAAYELISFSTASSLNVERDGMDAFTDFSVSDGVAAVPEPATWALLIVGFGAVGGVLRGRRGRTLASA